MEVAARIKHELRVCILLAAANIAVTACVFGMLLR
jgi:hypothetical protein